MKQGKTLMDLAAELEQQKETKKDYIASAPALAVATNGHTQLSVKGNYFPLNETAHEQLSSRLDIPKKYYDRMRKDDPMLFDTSVNRWLEHSKSDRYLVRTMDGNVRAFLSDRYRPLDNDDLAEVAIPALAQAGCEIVSCEVTEQKLYIKAVTERVKGEVAVGDVVRAGLAISNSEIGMGALAVEHFVERLVCKNGMIVPSGLRRAHLGGGSVEFEGAREFYRDETRAADDRAIWMKFRDTVRAIITQETFDEIIRRFRAAKEDRIIEQPVVVVEVAQKKFSLSDGEKNSVLQHLLTGGELNRFGLMNAITRTAQDVVSYDRATELEKLGGAVLELPKRDWALIAEARLQ
jgi:hypothetical protein